MTMKIAFRACRFAAPFLVGLLAVASVGCGNDDDDAADDSGKLQQEVVANYAELVASSYADSLKTAKDLDAAVTAFLAKPSATSLEAAKSAWKTSRDPYGETEAYRFYQGPIDNDDSDDDIPEGPEGLINSWPLDEAYIDYVVGTGGKNVSGGIINDVDAFPTIDAETLAAANATESETSISTGYHAIEFLLWGQDLSVDGPGAREYTDYIPGDTVESTNAERRGEYLAAVSKLLVDDLSEVNDAWIDGEKNYRADFLALPPREALGKILLGMGSLAGGELSHERMEVAYDNKEQEDEHSCFSDNTLADLHNNAKSVQNVLLGTYGKVSGAGIVDLVAAKNEKLAGELKDSIQEAIDEIDAVKELGVPFDVAITGDDDSEERKHIKNAIDALNTFKDKLVEAAKAIDIELKFDE
jgi:putative iron-regulated protein